jgi:probable F420-dependent oxidoreductase
VELTVVAVAREDEGSPLEAVEIGVAADRLGYRELWVGEGPTWDCFVLAAAIGLRTRAIGLTAGPVPVSVRDAATIARGAASAAALVGRPVGVALGTSSVRVVEGVHGRSRAGAAAALAESAREVRELTSPTRGRDAWATRPLPSRLPPAGGPLTVAAFGPRAIAAAVAHADRMLLDMVSPAQVAALRAARDAEAARQGRRTPPKLAAWLPAAVDPGPASLAQITRSIAGYLTVRGYREMFVDAGFTRAVELAANGADADQQVEALGPAAAPMLGLVGDAAGIRRRLDAYADAGLDEVALFPATVDDPAGERTLTALASR